MSGADSLAPGRSKVASGPRAARRAGKINAFCMEQSKKLWGELNHRTD